MFADWFSVAVYSRWHEVPREDTLVRLIVSLLLSSVALLSPANVFGEEGFFNSGGVRIRYLDVGSGEPVILVHGQGNRLEIWDDTGILRALAKDRRVIALDLRGHGQSDKPHEPAAYGPQMGQDIIRLMDHLKILSAHIVAYSAGCSVTVKLLTTNPERFVSAVLIAGSGRRLPDWTPAEEETDEAQARELERSAQSTNDPLALAAMVRARRTLVITEAQVEAMRLPILAIVGTADSNFAGVQQFKQQKPSIEMLTVQGATHGSPGDPRAILRQPETRDSLRTFLTAHAHDAIR